ncbi:MAG: alpha/beta fold hydrolase [Polyangiaceae bacterium]|nr:alpha/beta fold hydrolase [Polyangiaceae bacterium]
MRSGGASARPRLTGRWRGSTSRFLAATFWALGLGGIGGFACDGAAPGRTTEPTACDVRGVSALCGELQVPEDRAGAGPTARLQLGYVVLPAHGARRESPVFFLAGGPGQSATQLTRELAPLFEELRQERDIVLLDQRGTGRSGRLHCDTPDELTEYFREDFDLEALGACRARLGKNPAHYSTAAAADDLDELRAALGYDTINLVGASYGTRLALSYAARHPTRARALVLDGVAPPAMRLFLDALPDAQRALDLVFERCKRAPACAARSPHLAADFKALLARLAEEPLTRTIPHPATGKSVELTLTRAGLAGAIRVLLYSPELTALVPHLIREVARGELGGLAAAVHAVARGTQATVSLGLMLSVACAEDVPRITDAELDEAAARSFVPKSSVLEFRRACEVWLGASPSAVATDAGVPSGTLADGALRSIPSENLIISIPALILSGELDPVTPPRWGEQAKAGLPRGLHLVVPGAAHGTLSVGCVPRLMTELIRRGDAQGLDASCLEGHTPPPLFLDALGPGP